MERTETPAQGESRRSTEIPVPVATAPAPYSAAAQRVGPSDRTNTKPAVAKKLNAAYALEDYAAAKQALEHTASGTDGSESERGADEPIG